MPVPHCPFAAACLPIGLVPIGLVRVVACVQRRVRNPDGNWAAASGHRLVDNPELPLQVRMDLAVAAHCPVVAHRCCHRAAAPSLVWRLVPEPVPLPERKQYRRRAAIRSATRYVYMRIGLPGCALRGLY